jgi:hypothetical protein
MFCTSKMPAGVEPVSAMAVAEPVPWLLNVADAKFCGSQYKCVALRLIY